ncbi:MAG: hypothetical protein AAGJ79_00685 [Verrucomicrobiota bacterium]
MKRNKISQDILDSTLLEVRWRGAKRRARHGIAGVSMLAVLLLVVWSYSDKGEADVANTSANSGVEFAALEVLEVAKSPSNQSCIEWLSVELDSVPQTPGMSLLDPEELLADQSYAIVARSDGKKEMIVFQEL